MLSIEGVDAFIAEGGPFSPHWGWHDDHRENDQTDLYKPALQQVRGEFAEFLAIIDRELPERGAMLQLGMGNCEASHGLWRTIFSRVVTIDFGICKIDGSHCQGRNTHDVEALHFAKVCGPYDMLFIDAGHGFGDAKADHEEYGALVRPGGLIAFHDALPRGQFPEIGVSQYLKDEVPQAVIIGSEVGIAWYRKPL